MSVMGALTIGSAALSLFQNWRASQAGQAAAQNASEAELAAIKEVMDKIEREWDLPEYDRSPVTLEEYQLLGTYAPEVAKNVEESAPQLLQGAGQQEGLSAQREALRRFTDMAGTGEDVASRAAQEQANFRAAQQARANRQQLLQQLAQQGVAGTGQEIIAAQAGEQAIADQARQAALEAQQQAQGRRMSALQQMAGIGQNMQQMGARQEEANVGALNDFNQRATMSRRAWEQYRTGILNEAQRTNLQAQQNTANQNVALRNQGYLATRDRQDMIEKSLTDARNRKLQEQADLMSKQGTAQAQGISEAGKAQAEGMGAIASGIAAIPKVYDTASKALTTDKEPAYEYDAPGSTTSAKRKKEF